MKKQPKIEPRFLMDLRSALDVKHFTRRTKETYIYWITRYHAFLKSHRDLDTVPSTQKVEAFLSDMAPNVAAATQNQAFNALLFFTEVSLVPNLAIFTPCARKRRCVFRLSCRKKKLVNYSIT